MINDIYTDALLKYPLSKEEVSIIEDVWQFIEIFKRKFLYVTDFRNYLIKTVRKNYTLEQFYLYEGIVNKLFWNLRWILSPLFINKKLNQKKFIKKYKKMKNIPESLLLCKEIKYSSISDLDTKLKNLKFLLDNYYRSFINKLIIVDDVNKIVYFKQMEGSSEIFSKNFFNLYSITILFNRKFYEKIVKNPLMVNSLKIEQDLFYNQNDYGFPNLNFCAFDLGSEKLKMKRIKKMYYSKHDAKYWFRLIL
jgi:hypothetical protein